MAKERITVFKYTCERCNHEWIPRDIDNEPRVCPRCKSPYWNRPRRERSLDLASSGAAHTQVGNIASVPQEIEAATSEEFSPVANSKLSPGKKAWLTKKRNIALKQAAEEAKFAARSKEKKAGPALSDNVRPGDPAEVVPRKKRRK